MRKYRFRCPTRHGWTCATVYLPQTPIAVAVCLPGGASDQRYWDLEVEGVPSRSYSFARFLSRAGIAAITLDHLGTGLSAMPTPEPTPEMVTEANADAATVLLNSCGLSSLPTIGVGHSMGAALLLRQQVHFRSFARVAVLGYPAGELTMWRSDGRRRWRMDAGKGATAQADVAYTNVGPALDTRLRAAMRTVATPVPGPLANWVSKPGAVADLVGNIDVPVFLGFGERDVAACPRDEPGAYVAAPSVRLEVLQGSFHCHNLAPTRHRLWQALIDWALDSRLG